MISAAIRDRVAGVLLGLAAGDLHGGPVRMALRLAEGLVACGNFNSGDILTRYMDWYRSGAFDTGPVAEKAFARIATGEQAAEAVWAVHDALGGLTAGCNPAHRCPPLAMARWLPDDELAAAAVSEARLTHFDPIAGDVAAAVAVLCRRLLVGDAWQDALAVAAMGRQEPSIRALTIPNCDPLSRGGYAPDALAAAVHFLNQGNGFSEALDASVAFAGQGNYCPVLVGAIGGARWGSSQVPTGRIRHKLLPPQICQVAEHLAREW